MRWARTVRNLLLVVAAVVIALACAGYLILHTTGFNRFVARKIIQEAEKATGSAVTIRRMEIRWSKLRVDLYGLVIQGKESDAQLPFLAAAHIAVDLKIVSLLHRKVGVSELIVDQPSLDLRVNAPGQTSVPKPAPGSTSSNPVNTVFDLAIRHLAIHSGEVRYSDRTVPVSVDLRNFGIEAHYGLPGGTYQGALAYDQGRVSVKDFNPIMHAVRMNFTASRSELNLSPLAVTAGDTHFIARAQLTNYTDPDVQLTYEGTVSTPQLAQIMKFSDLPTGQVAINGSLRYHYVSRKPFLDSISAQGQFSAPQIAIHLLRASTDARSVKGSFSLAKGDLHVESLEAGLLQGQLRARGDVLHLTGRTTTHVAASLNGISLESVNHVLPRAGYDRLHFAGNANIDAQATWPNRLADIEAQARLTITAPQKPPNAGTIPLNGVIDVRYDGPHDAIDFGQSRLQTGSTQLSLIGRVSRHSDLAVQANTTDLREITTLVSEIRAAASGAATALPNIGGAAHFSGRVSGAAKDPDIQGQLAATNVEVEGSRWQSIQTNVQLNSSRIALQDSRLLAANGGQLSFSASTGLRDWSLTEESPVYLQSHASNMSVAALEHLARRHFPMDGVLAANITVRGTRRNPSGHGSIQITKASAWDQPVTSLSANFDAARDSIQATALLRLPAGNVDANVTFSPTTSQYSASLSSSGLRLDQVQAVQARNMGITGLLTVSAHSQGSFSNPQLSADLRISELRFRDQSISRAEVAINVAGRSADFALHSAIAEGNAEAKGQVELAGDYYTRATLDVRSIPVGVVLSTYISGVPPNLKGQAEAHASLSGPLRKPALLQARVEVPIFNLAYQSANIALVRPLLLDYRQGTATIQQTELKGSGTDLTLQGVIPVQSESSGFSLAANGALDLSLLQGFTHGIKSSGRVEIHLSGGGDYAKTAVEGQVKIENAYFSSDQSPVGIEQLNGQVNLSNRRLEIAQLKGTVGGGVVSMGGFMIFGSPSNFNFTLQGDSVRLRYPEGLRSVLNCDLDLAGTTASSSLTGRVIVDRLSFTQQFDLANFADQFSGPSAPSISPFERNLQLNVAVQTSQNLNLASSQVSLQGAANLNITGTLANPVILGRMNLNGGELFFLSKRFELQNGGTIEFANSVRTEPVLNLFVKTTVQQYDITLNFTGSIDRLRTSYTSDPALPAPDIISLLTTGQTAELSATSNTPASTSAESVVASGVAGQFAGRIQKLVGISQLTVDPLAAASNSADPASQISIQQRVTGNILLTFSTDVTSTQATSVQVQYRTSRQTSISVLRDQNGGYAIDLRVHKTF